MLHEFHSRRDTLRLLGLSAAITIAMVAIIPGRLLFTESRGRRDVLNAPMKQFAGDLAGHVHDANCIVTDGYWLAGNLVLRFPNKPVYTARSLGWMVVGHNLHHCKIIKEKYLL